MPELMSPGVYVEDVPPLSRPIAGVSTSTAAFVGVGLTVARDKMPSKPQRRTFSAGQVTFTPGTRTLTLSPAPWPDWADQGAVLISNLEYKVKSRNSDTQITLDDAGHPSVSITTPTTFELRQRFNAGTVTFTTASRKLTLAGATWPAWAKDGVVTISGTAFPVKSRDSDTDLTLNGTAIPATTIPSYELRRTFSAGAVTFRLDNLQLTLLVPSWPDWAADGSIMLSTPTPAWVESRKDESTLILEAASAPGVAVTASSSFLLVDDHYRQAPAGRPLLLTGWEQFKVNFGDISTENRYLAHAVFGFFNNGGSRCYVTRLDSMPTTLQLISDALTALSKIDEVSIVAAPMPPDTDGGLLGQIREGLILHCELMKDRVAVLDSTSEANPTNVLAQLTSAGIKTGYGALYFPWIAVSDPNTPPSQNFFVPPSGHIAGIYARNDAQRGVFKAPANETVNGALAVKVPLNKADQDGLNPANVNCIRVFNGAVLVWGARTVSTLDSQYRYINVRRYLNFLRKSIEQGTQWVVFEPNDITLWERIKRSLGDFLLNEWRAGALFGATPKQAFFVRCNEETNPPSVRDAGQVVTEIGVSIVKPAEFVVFRIQQDV